MRVLVVGATGAMGSALVPRLVKRGHQVLGTTRSVSRASTVEDAGGEAVVLDVLDRQAVAEAMVRIRPEVVIHQATALQNLGASALRKMDVAFARTNQLRTTGTENLLAAAVPAGTRRLLVQSFTGWPNERVGGPVKTEDDPFDPDPPANARETLAAIRRMEAMVGQAALDGVVLRYGGFYGPGTGLARHGEQTEMVMKRRFPVVGSGAGIWSLVQIEDAAEATVLAAGGGAPGRYNIVDDDPAPVREWLPYLAKVLGAPAPRHVPGWLARPLIGGQLYSMMTTTRGSSNAKAKRELGWHPTYPSWRQGFVDGLG